MKKERIVTIKFAEEEEVDPQMPIYFMDFINEAARVIEIRKEKEKLKEEKSNKEAS